MPGLSASELPPELLPGDVIEYYSRHFVIDDPRGHRSAVVLSIDGTSGVPRLRRGTNFMRRRQDLQEVCYVMRATKAPVIDLTDEVCSDLVGTEIRPGSATDHASDSTSEQSEADPAVPSAEEKEEEETPNQTSTDVDLLEAEKYVRTAPTRWMCKKIRHQAKKRAGMWSVFSSPNRRH
ncbi:uncharacterized protein PITG_18943 [Phytophthora infestans T30-4]|uniref:Uncharacterized protein n=1 Tax=Phytophthora infestans (strain T30-4) TaxID=403677 RepID=D0P025_PHYIT|nr:uncharacterized protein PITG_18943 [Phytophthora infestans T30-4]EEY70185.1 conserved hypothetical protein [Phytophthora infestans T30-4]|eukprot:XP_002997046.1 conserved hypothetical protein [Phytophthora infestans T30-4]